MACADRGRDASNAGTNESKWVFDSNGILSVEGRSRRLISRDVWWVICLGRQPVTDPAHGAIAGRVASLRTQPISL